MEVDGPAPARARVRASGHAAARRADRARRRARVAAASPRSATSYMPIGQLVDERAIVNGIVGAARDRRLDESHDPPRRDRARRPASRIDWDDFAELSAVVPLLARVYPNGTADVNHFHAAGGTGFLIRELLRRGAVHADVTTVAGKGLRALHAASRISRTAGSRGATAPPRAAIATCCAPRAEPFGADGGLQAARGNLGRAVIKMSAVKPQHRVVEAPARVFDDSGGADRGVQGRRARRDVSWSCATRVRAPTACRSCTSSRRRSACCRTRASASRWSPTAACRGASGKVPAAIHVTPEAAPAARSAKRARRRHRAARRGRAARWRCWSATEFAASRSVVPRPPTRERVGTGRELFRAFRSAVGPPTARGCVRRRERRRFRRGGRVAADRGTGEGGGPWLVADIGGTNARFALVNSPAGGPRPCGLAAQPRSTSGSPRPRSRGTSAGRPATRAVRRDLRGRGGPGARAGRSA